MELMTLALRHSQKNPQIKHFNLESCGPSARPRGLRAEVTLVFVPEDWSTSPVDEIVEHDENGYGHDGGGEEGVHDEALGEPLDVIGVRAQARHFKVDGAVRLHGL